MGQHTEGVTIPEQPPVGSGSLGGDPLAPPGARPIPTAADPAVGGPPSGGGPAAPERHRARPAGRSVALALLIFVTVVLVLFVVFNTQAVDISLVFGNVNAPLVLALVIAAALGGLVVGLSAAVVGARRRSRNRAGAQAG